MTISLNDAIWDSLDTAYGKATGVAVALTEAKVAAVDDPLAVDQIFMSRIWGHICHQGTPYPALFAAIPHLIEIVEILPPDNRDRAMILASLGYALVNAKIDSQSVGEIGVLDPTRFDCRPAIRRAVPLIAETLLCDQDDNEITAHLFATLAAIKGNAKLYFAMWGLFDDVSKSNGEAETT